VSPPPLDYECILNEPIWFNRFLYLSSDDCHGRLLNKDLKKWLINRGFTHLKHLRTCNPLLRVVTSPHGYRPTMPSLKRVLVSSELHSRPSLISFLLNGRIL
jgi:hypothetical protein